MVAGKKEKGRQVKGERTKRGEIQTHANTIIILENGGDDVKDYKMRKGAQAVMNQQDESELVVSVSLLPWQH